MKKVSVIIVTHNQKDLLTQCLVNLDSSTLGFKGMEVIIVDNASAHADHIKNLCAAYNYRYIRSEKNLSFSYANELAIKKSNGKYLLLLNDDTIPNQDGWVEDLLTFAKKHPKAAVVGCKLLYPQNQTVQHCGVVFNQNRQPYHKLLNTDDHDPRTITPQQFQAVTFGCALIEKSAYEKIGGFSHLEEKVGYHYEDIDFCFKARKAGYEIWYNPDVKVYHFSSSSFKNIIKDKKDNFKFLPALIKKWWIDIDHDDWSHFDMPPHNPHVVIGIPLADGCRWRFKQLMNMIIGLNYWKKNITLILGTDNCSQDFYDEILTWGKLNLGKYKEVLIPTKLSYTIGKVNSIIKNREQIRQKALAINASYLFFVDADVIVEKDSLKKLVNMCEHKGADIAAGVYFYKSPKHKPMLFKQTMPLNAFEEQGYDDQLKASSHRPDKTIGLGNFKFAKELMDGKIHEAGACHMGCTLIKRKCLEKIPFEKRECYGTEDLSWYALAQEHGFKLKVDTGMKLFHLDKNGYVYCWWNMDLEDDNFKYYLKPAKERVNVKAIHN